MSPPPGHRARTLEAGRRGKLPCRSIQHNGLFGKVRPVATLKLRLVSTPLRAQPLRPSGSPPPPLCLAPTCPARGARGSLRVATRPCDHLGSGQASGLLGTCPAHGLADSLGAGGLVLLVLVRHKADRPFRWLGRRHQLAPGSSPVRTFGNCFALSHQMRIYSQAVSWLNFKQNLSYPTLSCQ